MDKNLYAMLNVRVLTNVITEATLKSVPKIRKKADECLWNSEIDRLRKERQKGR